MHPLSRIALLARRNYEARKLGFYFGRSVTFRLPGEIRILGKRHTVRLPDEMGVRVALVDILLDDCYGLKEITAAARGRRAQGAGGRWTILDIGAHIGLFALAARNSFPESDIHLYEPNPDVISYLNYHAGIVRADVYHEAVGRTRGRVKVDAHEDSVQTRTIPDASGDIEQVPFSLAVDRHNGRVNLVKLDCEGAEWGILEDIDSWRKVDHLAMEYHLWEGREHGDAVEAVGRLGFSIIRHEPVASTYGLLVASRCHQD